MTVKQLHAKLGKEIEAGDGHHEVEIWAYGATRQAAEISSVGIKNFVHCSDVVVLETRQKLTLLKAYMQVIKQSFDEYFVKLKKSLYL